MNVEHWSAAHDVALKRAFGEPVPPPVAVAVAPRAPRALTDRQRAILEAIREHVKEHGAAPSIRELCAAVGVVSTNAIVEQLQNLELKGFIRRTGHKARMITLCDGRTAPPSGDHLIVTREDAKRAIAHVLDKFSHGDQVDIVTDLFKTLLKETG